VCARVKALRAVARVEEERLAALHLPELVSQTFNLRSDHKTNVRVRCGRDGVWVSISQGDGRCARKVASHGQTGEMRGDAGRDRFI
jgi:hypothetical protein